MSDNTTYFVTNNNYETTLSYSETEKKFQMFIISVITVVLWVIIHWKAFFNKSYIQNSNDNRP